MTKEQAQECFDKILSEIESTRVDLTEALANGVSWEDTLGIRYRPISYNHEELGKAAECFLDDMDIQGFLDFWNVFQAEFDILRHLREEHENLIGVNENE